MLHSRSDGLAMGLCDSQLQRVSNDNESLWWRLFIRVANWYLGIRSKAHHMCHGLNVLHDKRTSEVEAGVSSLPFYQVYSCAVGSGGGGGDWCHTLQWRGAAIELLVHS